MSSIAAVMGNMACCSHDWARYTRHLSALRGVTEEDPARRNGSGGRICWCEI